MQSPRFTSPLFVRPAIGLLLFCALLVCMAALVGQGMPRRVIAFNTIVDYHMLLNIIDVERHIVRRLSDEPVNGCCPIWSPDGTKIAFSSSNEQVSVINIYDKKTLRRIPVNQLGQVIAWSADGQRIILRTRSYAHDMLKQVGANGYNPSLLADSVENGLFIPLISPDGRFALYSQLQESSDESRIYGVYLLNLVDGTSRQLIDQNYTGYETIIFSPDSQRIALLFDQGRKVVVMNVDGSDVHSWMPPETIHKMIWSPDSTQLLFASQDDRGIVDGAYLTDVNGVKQRELKLPSGFANLQNMSWTSDGAQFLVLLVDRLALNDLYVVNVDRDDFQRLPFSRETGIFYPVWQPGK